MTTITDGRIGSERATESVAPPPPAWVSDLLGHACGHAAPRGAGLRVIEGGGYSLISGSIVDADRLGALDLQQAVCSLYGDIWRTSSRLAAREPVRFWNFIPGIHARMGNGDGGFLDRYMVFNAGRFAAYAAWYGEADMGPRVATATGIGYTGSDLVVHCLTSDKPGHPVENPRQVPAYRYSRRRGPMPPVFARATLINVPSGRSLLVGGTSSVCGESSVHLGDVRAQTLETFRNLACLVAEGECDEDEHKSEAALRRRLAAYRTLRVYYVDAADVAPIQELVRRYFGVAELELCRADVCRRTLLVEIEGTARVEGGEAVGGI